MEINFKRLLSVFLALVMVFTMLPAQRVNAITTTPNSTVVNENTTGDTGKVVNNEDDLSAALAAGGVVKLGNDIVVNTMIVVPAGVTATLDLNGKKISMEESILTTTYAINNLGTLTLKDSVGTGSVNARGIYNGYGNGGDNVSSAKLIVESGTYNAKGTNGGAAIFNYGIVEINGGTFTSVGGYSLNNQSGASMTVTGAIANNGIYNIGATLIINGGNISGNRSGCHVIYAWNSNVTINGGEFYNNNSGNATIMAAGSSQLTINNGTFGIKDGRVPGNGNTWTSCLTDTANTATMTVNGGTFNGGFRVQAGTTMTINGGSYNDCYGSNYNIYGTVTVKGGSFTDETAKTFASNNLADDYKLGEDGKVVSNYAAMIGNTGYATLQEAIDAAGYGDTITVLANIDLGSANVKIPAGTAVTLDLNGKVISGTCNGNEAYLIQVENTADLTIVDSSNPSTGKITYASGASKTGFTIDVKGDLILESGTIELTGSWNIGFAVDIRPNAWGTAYTEGTSFTMNGGKIVASDSAVRVDSNSSSDYDPLGVTFTMNGGEIESGWDAVFIQHRYANDLYVNIKNGTISGTNSALRIYGNNISDVDLTVTGGDFTGAVKDLGNTGTGKTAISGGTFTVDVSDYCAEGFTCEANGDGTYGVVVAPIVIVAHNQAELQAALDNFKPGTTIQLVAGVNYGTVYLRPNPSNPATKEIDWVGNNYVYESHTCFEGLTIKGAEDAIIDVIKIEGGTYYNTEHSQAATYPVMLSLIELKDVTIEGVTFTGNGGWYGDTHGNAISMAGCNIKVDGLTLKNCVLQDSTYNNRLLYKSEATGRHTYTYNGETYSFVADQKNITVTGCTFNGGYMGMELRETENVTITNNTFNGVSSRDILLTPNDGCTFSGKIIITGNTSDGAGNRFVRASGIGNAELTISDNTIKNYAGPDADFIKADGVTGVVTIANNTFNGKVIVPVGENGTYKLMAPAYVAEVNGEKYESLQAAIDAAGYGDTVTLLVDMVLESDLNNAAKGLFNVAADDKIVLDLNGHTISVTDNSSGNFIVLYSYGDLTVKNGTIELTATKDRAFGSQSTVILNRGGKLTIESGKYIHHGGDSMAITVDNSANSYGDAYLYVNGGEIISENYIAIRMRMEDPAGNGEPGNGLSYAYVTGGYIYGANRGIWGQKSSGANELQGELTVTGGTIENNNASRGAIQIDLDQYEAQNVLVSISGAAVIKGALKGGNDEFAVSGGTFNTDVTAFLADGLHLFKSEGVYTICDGAYDEVVTEPNCVNGGYTTYTCTKCGASHVADETEPAGHNNDGVVAHKDATCAEAGVVGGTYCTVCGEGKEAAEKIIPVLTHKDENNDNYCDNGEHVMAGIYNGYYYVDGEITGGYFLTKIDGYYYFVGSTGKIVTDRIKYVGENKYGVAPGNYEFDENGHMILLVGIVDDYYYENGILVKNKGLVLIGEYYYFVDSTGRILKNRTKWVNADNAGKHGLAAGNYEFDKDGHMVLTTGIKDGYYYENGLPAKGKGLIEVEGDYYFVDQAGKLLTNASKWISANSTGISVSGRYLFGEDGRMVKTSGLVQVGVNYYFIKTDGRVLTSTEKWVSATYAENFGLTAGRYSFDADGKMVQP